MSRISCRIGSEEFWPVYRSLCRWYRSPLAVFLRSAIRGAGASSGFALERLLRSPDLSPAPTTKGEPGFLSRRPTACHPGVEHAGLASKVAFGEFVERIVTSRGQDARHVTAGFTSSHQSISRPIPILRGRGFSLDEDQRTGPIAPALMSASLVQQLFPSGDPLGQQVTVRHGNSEATDTVRIVGVVPGTTQDILESESQAQIYLPYGARFRAPMVLHVGLDGHTDETTMLKAVQSKLRGLDGQLPILTARTMKAQRDASIPRWAIRAAAAAFGLFGCVALLIAALGVYGLQTYEVERRTRELGIRLALGATNWEIKALIVRQGLKTAAVALLAGLLLAIGVGRLLSSLLYRVSPLDPVALIVAALVLSIATLVACYLPARRATRLATVSALRAD